MDVVDILKEMILDFQQQRPTAGVTRQLAYKTMRGTMRRSRQYWQVMQNQRRSAMS